MRCVTRGVAPLTLDHHHDNEPAGVEEEVKRRSLSGRPPISPSWPAP